MTFGLIFDLGYCWINYQRMKLTECTECLQECGTCCQDRNQFLIVELVVLRQDNAP